MSTQLENKQPISQDSLHPEGFLAVNRTIFDHVRSGKLHPTAFGIYTFILQECDWGTGIWWGSAHRLVEDFGHTAELRTIRDNLARLFKLGFLKSLRRKGRRGNYFVLINKYRPTVGVLRGYELNADESIDLQNLVYNSRSEDGVRLYCRCSDGAVTVHRRCSDGAPYQDIQDVQASQEVQAGKPSSQPTCDGKDGRLGSPTSSDKDNTTANVKLFAGWMSDLIQKRTGERSVPNQREMNLLMRSIGDARPIDVIVGFYKFLARPKGVGGLGAPFAMFAQEWPYLERDAKEAVEECGSVAELVKELDEDINWGLYGDSDTQIERTQQLASQLNLSASGQVAAQN